MNTTFSNTFFYLSDNTQYEFHDENYCSCPQPQSHPHTVMGALLYELDGKGLQALDTALMGDDDDYEGSFDQWLDDHPAKTYYGSDKQAAIAEALQHARKDGKLVINHPEEFPWIFPLISTLSGVVGDGYLDYKGYLAHDFCECSSIHTWEQTVCRACYARLVSKVLHTFIFTSLRQSEGVSK